MFNGFKPPMENWSKLPHEFIEALPLVETLGELKVILYILRHTWGFQDARKRITLDEFMKGRKRKDGSRLDGGTGLTEPTVRNGLERAEKHGFIVVEEDDRDLARIKRVYSLRERIHPGEDYGSDPKNLSVWPKESLGRTKKETLRKKPEKDTGVAKPPRVSAGSGPTPKVPEAVRVYRSITRLYPPKAWYERVEKATDLEFWREVILTWVGLGWNKRNVKGMLDYYHRGELPHVGGGDAASQRRKQEAPSEETRRAFAAHRARRRDAASLEAVGTATGTEG